MTEQLSYDVAIVGGGLAGLACAILLAKENQNVILFEKEEYPFHKVCGEYISLESYDFLKSLGVQLNEIQVPVIKDILLSSPSGNSLYHKLPLGGFGISRYVLDHALMKVAEDAGVSIMQRTRVTNVIRTNNEFEIDTDSHVYHSKLVCAAYGKKSNLDVKWKRPFTIKKHSALNNYIGVKYHAMLNRRIDLIELHNFNDGYCGISPVEGERSCICYLTTAHNLRRNNNDIRTMEKNVLYKNPFLKKCFIEAQHLYPKPLVISQVSFDRKSQFENGVLFLGDSATMIAPLSGNGMSMALYSSRIAAACMKEFLQGNISLEAMGNKYTGLWKSAFSRRLSAGRIIQQVFGREWLSNSVINILKTFPGLISPVIRQTHGRL